MAVDLTLNGTVSAAGVALSGALTGTTGSFSSTLAATGTLSCNSKVAFNADGGVMVKMTNKTGTATVKGTVVSVYSSTAVDNAFALAAVDSLDPIGVVYEAGVADASEAWVTVSGIAKVLFKAATTRGQVARTGVTADSGEAAGYAMPMAVPANPNVAADDHFREIGHILESKDADALCAVALHFN